MLRCDEISKKIYGNFTKKRKFSKNFGKICWNFRKTSGNECCKTLKKIFREFREMRFLICRHPWWQKNWFWGFHSFIVISGSTNMVPSEFTEKASLCPLVLWICTKKNPRKRIFYKNSEYYPPNLANVNYIKLVAIAYSYVISLDWASREHQKMFPADMADFYQIFHHIKQIIRPSETQPYIKKQEKVSIPNFFDTCHH